MNWTKTPPTEPGKHYWCRKPGENWIIKDVWASECPRKLYVTDMFGEEQCLSEIEGEWGGRVPAPGTTWNVEQIKTWMDDFDKPEIRIKHPTKYNNPQALIDDPQSGLAATTARHRKEQG